MKRLPLSFLITILLDETNPDILCGRVRFIPTDEECTFKGVEELNHILREKAREGVAGRIVETAKS